MLNDDRSAPIIIEGNEVELNAPLSEICRDQLRRSVFAQPGNWIGAPPKVRQGRKHITAGAARAKLGVCFEATGNDHVERDKAGADHYWVPLCT